ncbi:MAG: hypothetical protein K9W46_11300 [Candidatus Heimdallarchaeum endolithica]|uniref:Uncharacterized protein n=1 Tax=Candidatus Heimdallarchaeum endolithica TaxID=2876572 RepID=A0A9Y1BQB0_9ARCH|nr:MAG: hypothetical protein K9W46_11300 [Candidatus Heimdallarchaeum endolithica]
MGRKTIKRTYKDTYARGQVDKSEFQGRYFIKIELVSLKVLEDKDMLGNESEFYFKVGKRLHKHRIPQKGTINLEKNEVFQPTDGLTLYTQFIHKPERGTIMVPFHLRERDPLKVDDHIIRTKLSIPLGSSDYIVLVEKSVKIKLKISALETRY